MFRDLYSEETILRTKKEYEDMLDKIYNKISKINGVNKMCEKIRKKIELIYQSMFKLHDDPWLRLNDLNKIDAIIDDEINFIWYRIFKKNRIRLNKINIDKHKDIDEYADKLTKMMPKKLTCWREYMIY